MTSEQVCHLVIKPQTALFRRSVAFELSRNDQMHDWGPQANWFVCHAWSNLFFPMIDAILNFFQHRVDAADAVIWMDLFCVSQHTDPEVQVSPMWWAGFSERIEDAGNMILVIDSWKDPKPLKRSWCHTTSFFWFLFCFHFLQVRDGNLNQSSFASSARSWFLQSSYIRRRYSIP
jgi:hypothetical protein